MKESEEYFIGTGMLTFVAIIISGIFILMVESFSGGSELFKFMTILVGSFLCFIWLYRFNREWFTWLPRASCIIAFIISNIVIFIFWYEAHYAPKLTLDAYQSLGYINSSRHSLLSTFGPLLLFLFVTKSCLDAVLFRETEFYLRSKNQKLVRLALLAPSFLLSVYIVVQNFRLTTIIDSIKGASIGLSIIFIVLAIGACVILFFYISDRLIRKTVNKDLESMPDSIIKEIQACYEDIMKDELRCLLHSVDSETKPSEQSILMSKIGGKPYAESPDDWPNTTSQKPQNYFFCMQLVLSSTNLPKVWLGRLIAVYLIDWHADVRSYGSPNMDKWVDIAKNTNQFSERHLSTSEIPYKPTPDDDDDEEAWEEFFEIDTAEYALDKSAKLRKLLADHTKHSERVLNSVLLNHNVIPNNQAFDIVTEGGAPHFIQGEHKPNCEICGNSMRFLFDFGEVLEPELTIGDASTTYIFGCDLHPENCVGFTDSH